MIALYTKDILILGVTDPDLEHLQAGEPLHVALDPPRTRITLLYRPTQSAILARLEELGFQVPERIRTQALPPEPE